MSTATLGAAGALTGSSDTAASSAGSGGLVSASAAGLPYGASARTFEGWFKSTHNVAAPIVSTGSSGNRFELVYTTTGSGTVEAYNGARGYVDAAVPYSITDGTWHLLDAVYDGSTGVVIYLDGQEIGTGNFSGTLTDTSDAPLTIGQDSYPNYLNGSVDEVAIYPSALAASHINAHWRAARSATCPSAMTTGYGGAVDADSPVEFFRLGDSASLAGDYSGNCREGAYSGAATHDPVGGLVSDAGGAVKGAGTDGLVAGTADGLPTGSTARTLEGWFRTASTSGQSVVMYGPDSNRFEIYVTNGAVGLYSATGGTISASATVNDNVWHALVGTYDGGTTGKLYLDGMLLASGTFSGALTSPAGYPIRVGTDTYGNTLNGEADDVAVYATALSASRVLAHYNAGALQGGPFTGVQRRGGRLDTACSQAIMTPRTGQPVDTQSGALAVTESDMEIPGRACAIGFARTYNSDAASINGPLGYGWSPNVSLVLGVSGTSPNEVATIVQENGSQLNFNQPASGSSWAPAQPRIIATLTYDSSTGNWTFVREGRDTFHFNSSGEVTSEVDLNGYTTTYSYTGSDLTSITDQAGRSISVGWTGSHITSLTDSNVSGNTRTVTFEYNDGNGNLTDIIDFNGGQTEYTYDGSHRITVIKDPVCYATTGCPGVQNHYDGSSRVDWQKDALNRETTFTYNSDGSTVTTDPNSNERQDFYNQGVRVSTTVGYSSSAAATTYFTYDPATLALTSQVDPNGNTTTYTVDSSGNVLTGTDPMGRVTTNTYNSYNELLTTEDGNGVTTTNTYNSNGDKTSTKTPYGSGYRETDYTYGDSSHPGDVTQMTDPNGGVTYYHYDSYGYRDEVKDPLGNVTGTTYNADGWKTSIYSARAGCTWGSSPPTGCSSSFETVYGYDEPGQPENEFGDAVKVTDPLGQTTHMTYDADRHKLTVTDANGNVSTSAYDVAGELCWTYSGSSSNACSSPPTGSVQYTYDSAGKQTTVTDANGNVTTSAYDSRNQVCWTYPGTSSYSCAAPPSGATVYTRDADGNVTKTVDPAGHAATKAYDGDNEVCWSYIGSSTNDCGMPPTGSTAYTYDSDGNTLTVADPNGNVTTKTYDTLNQVCWTYAGTSSNSCSTAPSGSTSFTYDTAGNVTALTDPNGNVATKKYNADNKVCWSLVGTSSNSCSSTPSGASAYTYDADNNLITAADPNGNTTTAAYDALNRECWILVGTSSNSCSSAPSGSTQLGYDDNGNITTRTDPNGNVTTRAYDSQNRVCWIYVGTSSNSCSSAPSGATIYTYDANGNTLTATDPNGNVTTKTYDSHNRPCWSLVGTSSNGCSTAPSGAATYTYDGVGNLILSTDPNGNDTTMAYDDHNRLCWSLVGTSSNACGTAPTGSTKFTYDANGNTLTVTNPNGDVTTQTYDSHNRVCWTFAGSSTNGCGTAPSGSMKYTYDSDSNVLTVTDPNGNVTTKTYDSHNRVCWSLVGTSSNSCSTAPSGSTHYGYDADANVTTLTDPDSNVTTTTYDSHNRVCWTLIGTSSNSCGSAPTGSAQYTYDNNGNVLTAIQPDGAEVTKTYDSHNRVCWALQGASTNGCSSAPTGATQYTYDDNGNVTVVTDPNGNATTNAYDAKNRVCWTLLGTSSNACASAPSGSTSYSYDNNGNVLTTDKPDGSAITATYDAHNRVCWTLQGTSSNSCTSAPTGAASFTYDGVGDVLTATDTAGNVTTNAYDSQDRLCWSYAGTSSNACTSAPTGATKYGYDNNGNVTSLTYPKGTVVVSQAYNALNEPCWTDVSTTTSSNSCSSAPSGSSGYTYDSAGNLTQEALPSGVTDNYTYDNANALASISDTNGGTTVFSATYTRNASELVTKDTSQTSTLQYYQYTSKNQVCYAGSSNSSACSSPPTGADAYAYDPAGNLITDNGNSQTFNTKNELCWQAVGTSGNPCGTVPNGATTYGYDSNGNRTSSVPSSGTATCNEYNSLDQVTTVKSGTGSSCTSPSTVATYSYDAFGLRSSKTVGGTTTTFSWNRSTKVPQLLQETSGSNTTSYIYGPTGAPLEEILPSGAVYYYAHDDQGSARALTDSSGTVQATYTYDPYGNFTATGSVQNNLLYCGQYRPIRPPVSEYPPLEARTTA